MCDEVQLRQKERNSFDAGGVLLIQFAMPQHASPLLKLDTKIITGLVFLAVAFVSGLFSGCSSYQSPYDSANGQAYTHTPSGIVFPMHVGNFERNGESVKDKGVGGDLIQYNYTQREQHERSQLTFYFDAYIILIPDEAHTALEILKKRGSPALFPNFTTEKYPGRTVFGNETAVATHFIFERPIYHDLVSRKLLIVHRNHFFVLFMFQCERAREGDIQPDIDNFIESILASAKS